MSEPLKVGSMFSGYGGLDLAVEAVTGATPAWFCEWEEAPAKALSHHWPHVPNPSSIRPQTQQLTSRPAEENTGDNNRERIFPNTTYDGRERTGQTRGGRPGSTNCHNRTIEWGRYAPAVRRWERIVGPAPAPTELNSNGNPRLNAAFVEWMMGLPAGWVTNPEIGLTRNQQLKMLGNGVCPPQAQAALAHLLERS